MSLPAAAILGCAGPGLLPEEAAFFRAADPWGFILFSRNVEAPGQLRRLTAALRDSVGRDAPVFIDQEGGRVQRLRPPHWRQWLPPLEQTRTAGAAAARAMWLRMRIIAAELRDVGIDANCAPVADLPTPATHPFLLNRCYGAGLDEVVAVARAAAEGLLAGGVLPVMKHMPGHGRAAADTHLQLPTVEAPLEGLRATDFAAFRALADLPMAMTAHVIFPALDPAAPVTLSPVALAAMRAETGFDGLLMTDDLSMEALSGPIGTRASAAVAAGCDLALHCNGALPEMEAVVAAAGRLTPAAATRAAAALARRTVPAPIDIGALEAELRTLLDRGAANG